MSTVDTSRSKQDAGKGSRGAARGKSKAAQAREQQPQSQAQPKTTKTRQKSSAKTKAVASPAEKERVSRSQRAGDGRFERSTFVDKEARAQRAQTAQSDSRRGPTQTVSQASTYDAFDVPPPGMDDQTIVGHAIREVMKTEIGQEQVEWAKQQNIRWNLRDGNGGSSDAIRPLITVGRDQQFFSIASALVHEIEHQRNKKNPLFTGPSWGLVHYQNDYLNDEVGAQVADIHFRNQWAIHENRPEVAIGNDEGAAAYWDAVVKTVGGTDFSSASEELLQKADAAGREALLELAKTKKGTFHGETSDMTYAERALENLSWDSRIGGTFMDYVRWGVEGIAQRVSFALGGGGGSQ